MFKLDVSTYWEVDKDLVYLFLSFFLIFLVYFFSTNLMKLLVYISNKLGKKLGLFSTSREYILQRYVYQHQSSLIAKLYLWVNEQLIALGMKRLGITVMGYLLFWGVVSFVLSFIICFLFKFGLTFLPLLFFVIFVVMLVLTRVMVSERIEKREADIMNAIDLIVPEIKNGVKNAIITYKDNFAPSIKADFLAFIVNIQDRGFSFNDAMYILADNLGLVFQDFAQKAIYFEAVGEKEMTEIFMDITETNRLRRQLRDENNNKFASLKTSFFISVAMVAGYFVFLMFTDDFSRKFFLQETAGKLLLLVIVCIVFSVLAYITTIKSKAI